MIPTVRRILHLAGPRANRLVQGFVWSVAESIFEAAPFIAIFCVFSPIARGEIVTSSAILGAILALVIGLVGRMICRYQVLRLQSGTGFEIVADQRIRLSEELRQAPMGFFTGSRTGEVTTTLTTDLAFLETYAMHVLDKVATGVIGTGIVAVFIFFFDWRMGIIFCTGLVVGLGAYHVLDRKAAAVSANQRQLQSTMAARTLEYVRGISVIKAFNLSGE